MRIYNSATHKKEEFQPIEPGKVRMYVCGPTVYDNIHIGNARTFISFDVIRRWLIASGYEVTFAQNLTDVDDKIIKRANEQGRTAAEVATEFSDKFIGVMRAANVLDPDVRPRATKEIAGRYGGLENLGEKLMRSENFEMALDELVWLITLLANQSVLIHNLRTPEDKQEMLTQETVELLTSPLELAEYKSAIMEAMFKGTKRNVESENNSKNAQVG